jgi:FKBP-type peptidyl-prolyl cis-trans isomerase
VLIFLSNHRTTITHNMNKVTLTLVVSLFATTVMAQTKKAPVKKAVAPAPVSTAPVLKNSLDSASYAFGIMMGTNLKGAGITSLNYTLLNKALAEAFQNQKAMLTTDQAQAAISNFFQESSKKQHAASIAAGKAFFEKNKQVAGVVTTASGLQYQVITPGNGEKPGPTASVKVHYKGTLLDGTQFDSSYDRGEATPLSVNNVIPGWTEGLQLMQTGAKYKLFVPYALAYGERAAGPQIPAYSDLIFEIELISIDAK